MRDSFNREIHYMRLSVTELCNMRCRYCMPAEGICKKEHDQMLTEEEMIMAVRAGASLGINKLRITGGEPLVKKNIVSICKRAAEVPGIKEVCITTNAVLLKDMAADLKNAGVTRLNISLDTMKPEKFSYITRIGSLSDVEAGIRAAFDAGFKKTKLNVVLLGGFNDDEVADFVALTKDEPIDVRFIELMPMYDSGDFGPETYIKCDKVLEIVPELKRVPDDEGVARLYHLEGAKGNVGLISPVSAHFCGTCNRIRVTADGKIKPCLHSSDEYNIKGLDEAGMKEQIKAAILGKPQCHGELSIDKRSTAGRNMNQIGG